MSLRNYQIDVVIVVVNTHLLKEKTKRLESRPWREYEISSAWYILFYIWGGKKVTKRTNNNNGYLCSLCIFGWFSILVAWSSRNSFVCHAHRNKTHIPNSARGQQLIFYRDNKKKKKGGGLTGSQLMVTVWDAILRMSLMCILTSQKVFEYIYLFSFPFSGRRSTYHTHRRFSSFHSDHHGGGHFSQLDIIGSRRRFISVYTMSPTTRKHSSR